MAPVPPRPPSRHTTSPPAVERMLQALGADPAFAESVLGDLTEEYAMRAARDGRSAARLWYVREALRSAPHLVGSCIRHASWHRRARWAAWLAGGIATVAAGVLLLLLAAPGPPVRLVAGNGDAEGVTVNSVRPVPLPMRVLDKAGRELDAAGVRYGWAAGDPLSVSPTGVLSCTRQGDATVRASLGLLSTRFLVRCRPVETIRAAIWNDFVLGEPERELPVDFEGPDGLSVTRIAGLLKIRDSSIATVSGLRIRPVAPGQTSLELSVGDKAAWAAVTVFEPVTTLEGLREDQRVVAAPVRLARGESLRWRLPTGLFDLVNMPGPEQTSALILRVDGPVMCLPSLRPGVYRSSCLARGSGAFLTVAHPGLTGSVQAAGTIGLQRADAAGKSGRKPGATR